MKAITILNLAISILRNFVSTEVVNAIKQALVDFAAHGDTWKDGERTDFVFDRVRQVAATSENTADDVIVEAIVFLYTLRFRAEGKLK